MTGWLGGWRAALRVARREARRARGRSALVLAMIMLPVAALAFIAVAQDTFTLTPNERANRLMGTAQALVAWPHDGLQHDKGSGDQLAKLYRAQQLNMLPEHAAFEDGGNGVEAGIAEMLDRMLTGRWKVFSTCADWLEERRLYHRKDGRIVKERDDVLSASRYGLMMLRHAAVNRPADMANKRAKGLAKSIV